MGGGYVPTWSSTRGLAYKNKLKGIINNIPQGINPLSVPLEEPNYKSLEYNIIILL